MWIITTILLLVICVVMGVSIYYTKKTADNWKIVAENLENELEARVNFFD